MILRKTKLRDIKFPMKIRQLGSRETSREASAIGIWWLQLVLVFRESPPIFSNAIILIKSCILGSYSELKYLYMLAKNLFIRRINLKQVLLG